MQPLSWRYIEKPGREMFLSQASFFLLLTFFINLRDVMLLHDAVSFLVVPAIFFVVHHFVVRRVFLDHIGRILKQKTNAQNPREIERFELNIDQISLLDWLHSLSRAYLRPREIFCSLFQARCSPGTRTDRHRPCCCSQSTGSSQQRTAAAGQPEIFRG